MTHFQRRAIFRSRTTLRRALRLTLWVVPILMAAIGVAFTLFENARHVNDSIWPWPTVLGLIVLGLMGPALAWLSLRWAIGTAEAYLNSEAQLARRNAELATLNTLAVAAGSSLDLTKTIRTALEQALGTLDAAAAQSPASSRCRARRSGARHCCGPCRFPLIAPVNRRS